MLLEMDDALVEGTLCLAFTSRGEYVFDTLRSHRQAFANGYGEHEAKMGMVLPERNIVELSSPALLVGLPTGGNYYHWLVEALSRELLARHAVASDLPVIVPRLRPMERQTLDAIGVDAGRVLELDPDCVLRVPKLFIPSRGVRSPARFVPSSVHALNALGPARHNGGGRIFISRRNARFRRIVNEPEVADLLEARGFEVLALERLNAREQIARFAQAEVVIGMHGAGLANLVFAKPGTTVVELQSPAMDITRVQLYWNLSAVIGASYSQVVCASAPDQADVSVAWRNIVVDCQDLAKALELLL